MAYGIESLANSSKARGAETAERMTVSVEGLSMAFLFYFFFLILNEPMHLGPHPRFHFRHCTHLYHNLTAPYYLKLEFPLIGFCI